MNDETLTFYYYKDGLSREEREQVANLLATDQAVARRYQDICQQLERLDDTAVDARCRDGEEILRLGVRAFFERDLQP